MAGHDVADSHEAHHGGRRGCTVVGCLLEYHSSGVDLAHKQGPAVLALDYEGSADDANRSLQYVGGHGGGERDGVVRDRAQRQRRREESGFTSLNIVVDWVPNF